MLYDLLHPPASVEKRKHKLKRLVQTPNSYFMVSRDCAEFKLINSIISRYVGCQVSRMLQHHNCVLPCTNSGALRTMRCNPLSANGRESSIDRRMLLPQEARLDWLRLSRRQRERFCGERVCSKHRRRQRDDYKAQE